MSKGVEYVVNYNNISVKLSDGSIIKGKVNRGHDSKRLSDYLKHSPDKFTTIVSEDPAENLKKVFVVNKDYIVWADIE
jgi:hypothetical protein